ncbi:hypothetical protein UFOVP225_4 [uncultured Caudovirales phage]|uniref:Uncharacterized protein n=1 Tax=uncultured Caudovirales phage TaxID=2100421 RepID=A0A6J7WUJ7_9CAUD|nr:hypothetical protein UFOVP113_17 [uncultured Caudovirales phage]CAB5218903.1 hypothetical protein UFOVP225_4 [uncultured Caudovirales phage]
MALADAYYPGNIKSDFSTKVNNTDLVDASHPNLLQNEVMAIETYLGVNPHVGTNTYSSSGYASGTSHTSVAARLTNLEVGILGDVHTQYVKIVGGSTITAATSSTKGLLIKGAASQSANLLEFQANGSTTPIAYITPAGGLVDTKVTADINNLYVLTYVFG